jgi:hypothetical protein
MSDEPSSNGPLCEVSYLVHNGVYGPGGRLLRMESLAGTRRLYLNEIIPWMASTPGILITAIIPIRS